MSVRTYTVIRTAEVRTTYRVDTDDLDPKMRVELARIDASSVPRYASEDLAELLSDMSDDGEEVTNIDGDILVEGRR